MLKAKISLSKFRLPLQVPNHRHAPRYYQLSPMEDQVGGPTGAVWLRWNVEMVGAASLGWSGNGIYGGRDALAVMPDRRRFHW